MVHWVFTELLAFDEITFYEEFPLKNYQSTAKCLQPSAILI